jgi:hypothetical protein
VPPKRPKLGFPSPFLVLKWLRRNCNIRNQNKGHLNTNLMPPGDIISTDSQRAFCKNS